MFRLWQEAISCSLVLLLTIGCSTIEKNSSDRQAKYQKSRTIPPLEVPPDLTSSINDELVIPELAPEQNATFSEYHNQRTTAQGVVKRTQSNVLPIAQSVQIKRIGTTRWLVIQEEPSVIWPKIKQFWLENGFTFSLDDPSIGVLETQWAENRADIPQDGIRKYLGKVLDMLYSAATRDKFRVRLERGQIPGTTELYLSHRGMAEVARGEDSVWQSRPTDPELEAEMLNRIMVFLGVEAEAAATLLANANQPQSASPIELNQAQNGTVQLLLREEFTQAWRQVGLALDRAGFTVEDRDREAGIYFIRYIDPEANEKKAFWDRMFGDKSERISKEYQMSLIAEQQRTRIVINDNQGQLVTSQTAEKILSLLYEQLQ